MTLIMSMSVGLQREMVGTGMFQMEYNHELLTV